MIVFTHDSYMFEHPNISPDHVLGRSLHRATARGSADD
jgi:hypothetical protein